MLGELDPPLGFEEIEPLTRATLTFGQSLKGSELVEAEMAIGRAASLLASLFDDNDVLLTPMLSSPPPAVGAYPTDHGDLDHHERRKAAQHGGADWLQHRVRRRGQHADAGRALGCCLNGMASDGHPRCFQRRHTPHAKCMPRYSRANLSRAANSQLAEFAAQEQILRDVELGRDREFLVDRFDPGQTAVERAT